MKLAYRHFQYITVVILCILYGVLLLYPINRKLINYCIIGTPIVIYAYTLYLLWHKKYFRSFLIAITVIAFAVLLFFDGKIINRQVLSNEYKKSLIEYKGTKYMWGGENFIGIDCSGLVRRGLIDTYFKEGFKTFSPRYIRKGLKLWFYDCSAEALKDGYRNYTKTILINQKLNTLNYKSIKIGDIMVTNDGVHTMAYIGDKEWIQADPGKKKVIIEKAPSKTNYWYGVPVTILRWSDLK